VVSRFESFGIIALLASGCGTSGSANLGSQDPEVKVDTRSAEARAQYDADVAFLNAYTARCAVPADKARPRVLVTGFGRFLDIADNATGRIVSTLVPGAKYPETMAPPAGAIDPPEPQLSVAQATLEWPASGVVEVCAMILPVYWDMAAVLIARELDAFRPNLVMMNGVAGARQDLWLELGATNAAVALDDGSDRLRPSVPADKPYAELVDGGDKAQPNLMSWNAVHGAALAAASRHADEVDGGERFGDILTGVKLAGFPRDSNTYLCNNVTYVTGWLMNHAEKPTPLLRADPPVAGKINEIEVKLAADLSKVPRLFVHWPTLLATTHHAAGAAVMQSILDAQIAALAKGDAPTPGDNANADPSLAGGATF
jgi:pyrrolidone-carboxylate peptidase